MATTTADVKSAAELERQRLAAQAAKAREAAQAQAQEARAETEAEAQRVITETEAQAEAAKAEARTEAKARQADIKKMRGQVEREAQAAMARAQRARSLERRKVVLPFTKPRELRIQAYIAEVESVRKQAHRAGQDEKAAVSKVRDAYFKAIDRQRDEIIADINQQKAGIGRDIEIAVAKANAEINKQVAAANSGISVWEAQTERILQDIEPYKIGENQYDSGAAYQATVTGKLSRQAFTNAFGEDAYRDIQATLNRPGAEVFADMKREGIIPNDAIYESYDKATGQVSFQTPLPQNQQDALNNLRQGGFATDTGDGGYTISVRNDKGTLADIGTIKAAFPDLTTEQVANLQDEYDAFHKMETDPEGYFKDLQAKGEINPEAKYIGYDPETGAIQYTAELTDDEWRRLFLKQPRDIQRSYIFRQAPWTGKVRDWYQLSDKEKQAVLKDFSNEFSTMGWLFGLSAEEQKAEAKRILKEYTPRVALMAAAALLPKIIPVVPVVVGRALSAGVSAGFIGLGVYGLAHTVKDVLPNPDIPTWQKGLAIGLDTACIAAGLYGLKGLRAPQAKTVGPGETKVTIGKEQYVIPNNLADSIAKTAATKGGLTAAQQAECTKAIRTIQQGVMAKDTELVMRGAAMLDKAQGGKILFSETAYIRSNPKAYIDQAYQAAKAITPEQLTANTRFVKAKVTTPASATRQTIQAATTKLAKATSGAKAIRAQATVSKVIRAIAEQASKEYNTLKGLRKLPTTRLPLSPQTQLLQKPRPLTPLEYSVYKSIKSVPKLKGWTATTKADSAVILAREIPGHVRVEGLTETIALYGKDAVKGVYPKLTGVAIRSARYLSNLTSSYYRTFRQAVLSDVQNRVITNLTGQPMATGTKLPPLETVTSEQLVAWRESGLIPSEVIAEVANTRPIIQIAVGGAFKYTPTVDTPSKLGLKYPLYIDDNTVNARILETLGGKFTVYGEGGITSTTLTPAQLRELRDIASYDVAAPLPELKELPKIKEPKVSLPEAKELQLTKPVDVPLITSEFPQTEVAKVLKSGTITETPGGYYAYEAQIQRFDEKMLPGERFEVEVGERGQLTAEAARRAGGREIEIETAPEVRLLLRADNLEGQAAEATTIITESVKHNGFVKTINTYGRSLTTAVYPYAIAYAAAEADGGLQISFISRTEPTRPTRPVEPTSPVSSRGPAVATETPSDIMAQPAVKTLVATDVDLLDEWVKPGGTSTPEIIKATEQAAAVVAATTGVGRADAITVTKAGLRVALKAALNNETQGQIRAATENAVENSIKQSTRLQTQTEIQKQTLTTTATAVTTNIATQVTNQIRIQEGRITPPGLIITPPGKKKRQEEEREYPDGTIVWRMGQTDHRDVYKIIPPPYTMAKPITSRYPPRGMTRTKGTPQETLTFIGGKIPFQNVSFDLGVTDGFIDVKARKIRFTGGGQKTNVGTRIESTTKGVALVHNPPQFSRPRNGRRLLVSRGIYTDKKNARITRRRHRGWKRIY